VVCFSGQEMAGRKSWRSRGERGERAVVRTPGPLDLRAVSECAVEKIQRPFTTDDDKEVVRLIAH
jgi:hypothetical protein